MHSAGQTHADLLYSWQVARPWQGAVGFVCCKDAGWWIESYRLQSRCRPSQCMSQSVMVRSQCKAGNCAAATHVRSVPRKVLHFEPEQKDLQSDQNRGPVILDVPACEVHHRHQHLHSSRSLHCSLLELGIQSIMHCWTGHRLCMQAQLPPKHCTSLPSKGSTEDTQQVHSVHASASGRPCTLTSRAPTHPSMTDLRGCSGRLESAAQLRTCGGAMPAHLPSVGEAVQDVPGVEPDFGPILAQCGQLDPQKRCHAHQRQALQNDRGQPPACVHQLPQAQARVLILFDTQGCGY